MKVKIILDTKSAAARLVEIAAGLDEDVHLTDGSHMRVSAKSLLGTLYAQFDFNEIYLETENEHYYEFKDFIAE